MIFWLGFLILTLIAMGFIWFGVKKIKNKKQKIIILICLPLISFIFYLGLGNYSGVMLAQTTQETSPTQLILHFTTYLTQHPQDDKAWFLLGRLRLSQNQYAQAAAAFREASELSPQNKDYLAQYAQALFFANHLRINSQIKSIALKIPYHPLILNLQALAAYQQGDKPKALKIWQQLLHQLPKESNAYKTIAKIIKIS